MGRPRGSRNADYQNKRCELAKRVAHTLVGAPADHVSLRELARAADVSVSTMRHYFEDRTGLVEAALEQMGKSARRHLDVAIPKLQGSPQERLVDWMGVLVRAWTGHRVGRAHAVGLAEGLYSASGPSYVRHLYQPFVEATIRVLDDLEAACTVSFTNHRRAAIVLLAPIQTALFVHESLQGEELVPLDLDAMIDEHVARFLKGWVDLN